MRWLRRRWQIVWQGREAAELAAMARLLQDNEGQTKTYTAMQLWRAGYRRVA